MYTLLEQALLRTICWFDIFKYPLTIMQCWRLLYDPSRTLGPVTREQVDESLSQLQQKSIVSNHYGFWQLSTSPDYYWLRQERYRVYIHKYRRAKRWARLFTYLPSVRLIALVNSLGYRNPEPDDDIDLFIITKAKKIWLTRWWLTGVAKLLGLRPTIGHQQDGLCLSFYLSDQHLSVTNLMINAHDVYFHFWFTQMTILFDDGVSRELVDQNSDWLKCFPNLRLQPVALWSSMSNLTKWLRIIIKPVTVAALEPILKQLQLYLLPQALAEQANKDTSVVLTDELLKFHHPDRRAYYFKEWQTKLTALGI